MLARLTWILTASITLLGPAATIARAQAGWTGACVEVVDGDTLVVARNDEAVTVRLDGIDCPELGQPLGPEAQQLTTTLAAGKEVDVRPVEGQSAGPLKARLLVGETDLSQALLDAGLAWHDTANNSDQALLVTMIQARAAKRGLWADPEPEPPWQWRQRSRPSPVPARRRLADVAAQIELERSGNGQVVIANPTPSPESKTRGDRSRAKDGSTSIYDAMGMETCCCELHEITINEDGSTTKKIAYERMPRDSCEHAIAIVNARTGYNAVPDGCVSDKGCD